MLEAWVLHFRSDFGGFSVELENDVGHWQLSAAGTMTLGAGSCGLQARSGLLCHGVLVWWRLRVGGLGTPFWKRLRLGFSEIDVRHWQLLEAREIHIGSDFRKDFL